jgi:GTP pyrophosphokinase/guanosine-3',5'-bis(diphosphate) 3'-pyrophosphohydrolase
MMVERGIKPDAVTLSLGRYTQDDALPAQSVVFVDGSEGHSIQLAHCCRPIPGDAIVGYLGRGEGLLVHTADCPTGKRLFERDSERWMQVDWAEEVTRAFETSLFVQVKNGKGVLAQVASAISAAEADIVHLDMDPEPPEETIELRLLVSVRDRVHLAEVLRTLRRAAVVQKVSRTKFG